MKKIKISDREEAEEIEDNQVQMEEVHVIETDTKFGQFEEIFSTFIEENNELAIPNPKNIILSASGDNFTVFKMDSGASIHITTLSQYLFDTEECNQAIKVAKSNTFVYARLKGKMFWYTERGQRVLLQNVYYVPEAVNLISVKQLCQQQLDVAFSQNKMTVSKKGKLILSVPTNHSSLGWEVKVFHTRQQGISRKKQLKMKYQQLSLNKTWRYHLLFGHPCYRRLNSLLQRLYNKSAQ